MSALQSRIAAFESLAGGAASHSKLNAGDDDEDSSSSLIDSPLPAATAAVLQPPVVLTPSKHSPSPSPPNLGRKTSLIDLSDWVDDDKRRTLTGHGLLINLESSPPKPSLSRKAPPALPPRKMTSYTSLKSVASTSSSHSPPSRPQAFLYPPRPRPDGAPHAYPPTPLTANSMEMLNNANSRHTQGSSISSFHSISLSSDTDSSTPGSISNFIATYPIDQSDSLSESYEDVSSYSLASPATERNIALDFDKARAKAANRGSSQTILLPSATIYAPPSPNPPKLPQRPSPPNSVHSSHRSPPPLPSRNNSAANHHGKKTSGASTPRSTPTSPVMTPVPTAMIPTTYAIRRAPPPPPSRSSYASASDRSSILSTFSTSSSSHSHGSRVLAFNSNPGSLNALSAAARTKRPTPVPLAARKRYEKVFVANVIQRRKVVEEQCRKKKAEGKGANGLLSPDHIPGASPRGRRAAGWRGLSVDLITGDPETVADRLNGATAGRNEKGKARDDGGSDSDDDEDLVKIRASIFEKSSMIQKDEEVVGKDERLEGDVVKLIWKRSQLEKRRLAEIWNECDPGQTGSLDLEGFIKGMWRIDEELRRSQAQLLKSVNTPGGPLNMRSKSANSSRTSLLSKHSSIASNSGRPGPTPLSRQSSAASQRSTTLGSRNAAYQKLTGSNPPPPPPPSAFSAYNPRNGGGGSYNGNTPYGAGYNGYGGGTRTNNGSSGIGQLSVTVPSVVRNILRGS